LPTGFADATGGLHSAADARGSVAVAIGRHSSITECPVLFLLPLPRKSRLDSGMAASSRRRAYTAAEASATESDHTSFVPVAECGKQRRMAYCTERNNCSSSGTAFMQYADSLALSVRNKEMTEAEALRRLFCTRTRASLATPRA
jgi:hypothetical protein